MGSILSAFAAWLGQQLQALMDFLSALAQGVLLWAWEQVLDALGTMIELLPVPEALTGLGAQISSVHPSILYLLAPFQIGTGMGIIGSALLVRFLIRRLPIVG